MSWHTWKKLIDPWICRLKIGIRIFTLYVRDWVSIHVSNFNLFRPVNLEKIRCDRRADISYKGSVFYSRVRNPQNYTNLWVRNTLMTHQRAQKLCVQNLMPIGKKLWICIGIICFKPLDFIKQILHNLLK